MLYLRVDECHLQTFMLCIHASQRSIRPPCAQIHACRCWIRSRSHGFRFAPARSIYHVEQCILTYIRALLDPPFLFSSFTSSSKMYTSLLLGATLFGASQAATIPGLFKRISSGCSPTGPLSCSSNITDTCCTESPGGLLLHPQFWDTNPSTGPLNSFTIHGLW